MLRGSIGIEHDGRELDRFSVEIDLGPLHSGDLPIVRETAGRIPQDGEHHVNEDGSCCVCLPEDYLLKHPGAFDLLIFLDGPVRNYLIAQALVESGDPWPHGEWGHGAQGQAEWLRSFLAGLSPERARAYVETLATREIKGHLWCPCGSQRRVRDCHKPLLERLRRMLPQGEAKKLLGSIRRQ